MHRLREGSAKHAGPGAGGGAASRKSVQTARGETIGVAEVLTNVLDFSGVPTVKIDPEDQDARLLSTGMHAISCGSRDRSRATRSSL